MTFWAGLWIGGVRFAIEALLKYSFIDGAEL